MIILLGGNYKGGVGKTVNNVLLSHELAERGYRVLFIDFDQQQSGTRVLSQRSMNEELFEEKNIFEAIKNDDLAANIIEMNENISYVAGSEYINSMKQSCRKRV